jgi:hypothetical protein
MKPSGLYAGRFSFSIPPNSSHSHTRSDPEGSQDGRKDGDDEVQDFACQFFLHWFLIYEL